MHKARIRRPGSFCLPFLSDPEFHMTDLAVKSPTLDVPKADLKRTSTTYLSGRSWRSR